MEPWEIEEHLFQHPFTCMIAGPTQSGKTHFLMRLLENLNKLAKPKIQRILYCYGSWQPMFEVLQNSVPCLVFFEGIPEFDDLDPSITQLVILDDLMEECTKNEKVQKLFIKDSHHLNTSVILVTQNLYAQGRFSRSIALNCHYLVLFKNPRDLSQIGTLGRQMFPGNSKFLVSAFKDATDSKKFGYLYVDLKPNTILKNRIQTNILTGDQRIIYTCL